MLGAEAQPPLRTPLRIAALVLGGMAIGLWHQYTVVRGRPDPVTGLVRTVTIPLVAPLNGLSRWVGREFGWITHGRALEEEADVERQRLRAQLGFALAPPSKAAADVVSLRPDARFETLIANRGSRDGIHLHAVVAAPSGLVGQVYDLAPSSAAVLLLTDPNSSVGARVQRGDSRAVGVSKGDGSGLLLLDYLRPEADVKVGDTVVSSGLGGPEAVYPKGIVIGRVVSVTTSGATRSARVKPAVDFDRLEEVYLLR